jgi:outer membrane protein assembly factor BamA
VIVRVLLLLALLGPLARSQAHAQAPSPSAIGEAEPSIASAGCFPGSTEADDPATDEPRDSTTGTDWAFAIDCGVLEGRSGGGWALSGAFVDDEETTRAIFHDAIDHLLEVTAQDKLSRPSALACQRLSALARDLRYELTIDPTAAPGGGVAFVIRPLALVRSVSVSVDQALTDVLLDDEIARRLRLRPGDPLPTDNRKEFLRDEEVHINEYLADEGFFAARTRISLVSAGELAMRLKVNIDLGPSYKLGKLRIGGVGSAVSVDEIRAQFDWPKLCLIWCFGRARFTRAQLQNSLQKVVELYQRRGFPAVRVTSNYQAKNFSRNDKTIPIDICIDERRQLDVVFEGNDRSRFSDGTLRRRLTFNTAASSDDYEAQSSADAIARYYQGEGRYDARVTWTRERFAVFDRVVFRIDERRGRQVKSVSFTGNRALSDDQLRSLLVTQPYRSVRVFATTPHATTEQLSADADRIRARYAERGYLATQVEPQISPSADGLGSALITAGLVAADASVGELHVRFRIVEGPQKVVRALSVTMEDSPSAESSRLCEQALAEVATALGARITHTSASPTSCQARIDPWPWQPARIDGVETSLRAWFDSVGLKWGTVTAVASDARLSYKVKFGVKATAGRVLVRGNFRTRRSVIVGEFDYQQGAPLTSAALLRGSRSLRSTGLFSSVDIDVLDGKGREGQPVHAVLKVQEKDDARLEISPEIGWSSQSGYFVIGKAIMPNISGIGLHADVKATVGSKLTEVEATGRVPRWIARRMVGMQFDTELSFLYRRQDTERFGPLGTKGFSLAATRSWQRDPSDLRWPRVISATLRYDLRLRNRDDDAIRPAGSDADLGQVPIGTRTGSIGVSLSRDSRIDLGGDSNPLAPARGSLLEAKASIAGRYLGGQDLFIKASLSGQKYVALGKRVVLRGDFRLDQGFPLGGSVLLPEVERFFAGGDSTVRGFDDDQLATEIVDSGIPPFDDLTQIRILPAGGNIRAIASLDAQLLLGGPVATALFVDAGMIRNRWPGMELRDIRPAAGLAICRIVFPFGAISLEYAVPLVPRLGDDPRGRFHFGFAFRQ